MASLLERSDQAVSVTEVARSAKKLMNSLTEGKQDRYVIMRNNMPAAVLLGVDQFEAIMEELENLRIETLAAKRLKELQPSESISHEELKKDLDL